jgi:hypothetical protein
MENSDVGIKCFPLEKIQTPSSSSSGSSAERLAMSRTPRSQPIGAEQHDARDGDVDDLEQLDDAVGIGLNEAADADLADAEIKAFEQGIANRGSDDNLNDCACPFLLEALSIELHGRGDSEAEEDEIPPVAMDVLNFQKHIRRRDDRIIDKWLDSSSAAVFRKRMAATEKDAEKMAKAAAEIAGVPGGDKPLDVPMDGLIDEAALQAIAFDDCEENGGVVDDDVDSSGRPDDTDAMLVKLARCFSEPVMQSLLSSWKLNVVDSLSALRRRQRDIAIPLGGADRNELSLVSRVLSWSRADHRGLIADVPSRITEVVSWIIVDKIGPPYWVVAIAIASYMAMHI